MLPTLAVSSNFHKSFVSSETGMVAFGEKNGYVDSSLETLRRSSSDVEGKTFISYPTASEFRKAFPAMRVPDKYVGCMDSTAGILRADKALLATRVKTWIMYHTCV